MFSLILKARKVLPLPPPPSTLEIFLNTIVYLYVNTSNQVEYRLEDIGQEFTNMDNYATGCVSLEEFRALLSEMCIHLSEYELQILAKKFSVSDGR